MSGPLNSVIKFDQELSLWKKWNLLIVQLIDRTIYYLVLTDF